MARNDDLLVLVALGLAGVYAYQHFSSGATGPAAPAGSPAPSPVSQLCKFPDGTYASIPVGNACPYDAAHGGQSTLCPTGTYPSDYHGPFNRGASYC